MSDMTISQCLRRVSKLKGELKELMGRASLGVQYSEDAPPAFAFWESLAQADGVRAELVGLESALRVTNANTKITFKGQEVTLSEATIILQETKGRVAWLNSLAVKAQAKTTSSHVTYDEMGERVKVQMTTICMLPEAERARMVRDEQNSFDELNDLVENVNHRTVLSK